MDGSYNFEPTCPPMDDIVGNTENYQIGMDQNLQTGSPCNITTSIYVHKAEDIVNSFVMPCICVVGIVLNLLNLIVFCQSYLKGTCFTFLTALSMADMTTLTIVLPLGFSRQMNQSLVPMSAKLYEIYVFYPLGNSSATLSIWVTTTLTIERLVSVKKYAIASKTNSICRARVTIVLLALGSLLLNLPLFFVKQLSEDGLVEYSDFAFSDGGVAFSWVRFTLAKIAPCALIFISNAFLIYEVWQSHKRRKLLIFQKAGEPAGLKYQVRLTVMLICVSIGFMIGNIPEALSQPGIVKSMFGTCSVYTDEYRVYRVFCNSLESLSYAYHFFVYMICNQQFRQILKRTLCCYKCRKIGKDNNQVWPATGT